MRDAKYLAMMTVLWGSLFAPSAYAEVPPVVDLMQESTGTTPPPPLPSSSPSSSSSSTATTSAVPDEPLPAPTESVAAPVSAAAKPKSEPIPRASLPLDQRIARLERQSDNMAQMDLLGQISNLQQEVAKLRGELDVQTHDLKLLKDQVRIQYEDVDRRLAASSTATAPKPATPTTPAVPLETAAKPTPKQEETAETIADAASSDDDSGSDASDANTATADKDAVQSVKSDPVQEQKEYLAANKLLIKGDYVRATAALESLISKYPKSQYAPSSHYWLGEVYLKQGQPDLAVKQFKIVITNYPKHTKIPEAMLKLGFAYYDKGDFQTAQTYLQRVKDKYPKSTVAQLASARLEEMKAKKK